MTVHSRVSKKVWRVLKVFGLLAGIVLALFIVALWVIDKEKDEWLLGQIQTYMRESQSGELKIGKVELRLLKNFPDVTLELDSIYYYERTDSIRQPAEQPILHAKKLFVAVELLPLLKRQLTITEVSLSKAQVTIVEYANGTLNINRALAKPVKPRKVTKRVTPKQSTPPKPKTTKPVPKPVAKPVQQEPVQINLHDISLSEVMLTWKDKSNSRPSVILLKELECEFSNEADLIQLEINADHQIQALHIQDVTIPNGDVSIEASLQYDRVKQYVNVIQGNIQYDVFTASVKGTYDHQKKQLLNLDVDASSNDLQVLSTIIKPEILDRNPDLLKKVDVYIKGKIFGELATQPPQVKLQFGLKDLDFNFLKRPGSFKGIGFDGSFSSGDLPDYSRAVLEINNIRGQLPGGFIKGNVHLKDFVNPYLRYDVSARIKLDDYDEIFRMTQLKKLKGTIAMDAHFDGLLKQFSGHGMDKSRHSAMVLDNLSFQVTKTNQFFSGLSGKIENRNNVVTVEQLQFTYGENDLLLNARIDNFVHFLFNQENEIRAIGKVQSRQLYTKDFILDTLLAAQVQDRISNLTFDFQVNTVANPLNKSKKPDVDFIVENLTATFDELPDIRLLNTKGTLTKPDNETHLEIEKFQAVFPHGRVDVTGNLFILKKDLWKFNAHAKLNKFPWTYVKELVAEMKEDDNPKAKNLSVKEMDIVNADVYLDAAIVPYPFDIVQVKVEKGWASYAMPKTEPIAAKNINLSIEHLYFIHPENTGFITGLKSTKGTIQLKQLKMPGVDPADYKISLAGEANVLNMDFVRTIPTVKKQYGQIFMDVSKKEIDYKLKLHTKGANLEYFIDKYSTRKNLLNGFIDFHADLQTQGADWNGIKKNLKGSIDITGKTLLLYGVNIDDVLARYEESQNFNLTDLGAVVIAGPVGLAVTKGSDFVSLANVNLDSTQQTTIKVLLAKWKVENSQLTTEDVAFTTTYNRVAFNGQIDFANDSIPGLTIAVVDKNGCSLMHQNLYGKMNNLQTGKLNITKTLLGSVINFVNAVVGKDCKPIYNGMVKAPVQE